MIAVKSCDLWPVEDGSYAGAVGAVPVHVEPRGQQNAVLYGYGAVRERRNEQLVPAWRKKQKKSEVIHDVKTNDVVCVGSTDLHTIATRAYSKKKPDSVFPIAFQSIQFLMGKGGRSP